MVFFSFLSFFIILSNLFLLAFTLLEKKSDLRKAYSFLLSSLTLWILGFAICPLFPEETQALIWLRCSWTGLVFLPATFLHFVLAVTMDHRKIHLRLNQIGYLITIVLTILNLLGGLIQRITFKNGFYYPEVGLFYPYYGITFIFFISYGSWLLYQRYKKTKSQIEKDRLKFLIIGGCFGILGSLFNILLNFVGINLLYLIEFLLIVIFNMMLNYVCIRYKLIEVNTFIRREHIHYLTLSTLIGFAGVGILILQKFYPYNFFVPIILLAFGLGLTFQIFTPALLQFIEKRLFKETLDKKELLKRLSQNITSTFDKDLLLPSILDVIVNIIEIKTAAIILFLPNEEECEVNFAMGIDEGKRRKALFSKTKGLLKWFGEDERMILKAHLRIDPKFEDVFEDIENDLEKVEGVLAIPFVGKEGLIGVLCLGEKKSLVPYNDEDIVFLATICDETTVALENTFLHEKKIKYFLNTIMALVFAIEAKDKYTKGHCENVGRYAAAISEALGMSPQEVENIKIGGYLHDIGKIGIDEKILLKPSRLTREEFEEIKKHPDIGVKILEAINLPKDILHAVKYHHERIKGDGYPEKLTDDGSPPLPLVASIIAVADSYEAMTSDRPYRKALDKEDAMDELRNGSGKFYDPKIVEVFLDLLEEGKV
ncbi:MAG: HD domain-containing phosphohydrolase [Nitrospirota bacterium]